MHDKLMCSKAIRCRKIPPVTIEKAQERLSRDVDRTFIFFSLSWNRKGKLNKFLAYCVFFSFNKSRSSPEEVALW